MDWSWLKTFGDVVRGRKTVSLDDLKKAMDVARDLNEWLRKLLPIGPEILPEMSYPQAIQYFVNERPKDSRAVKGAMLLQDHPQGSLLLQVFLDKSNELVCDPDGKPYGRRLIVKKLDAELSQTFGGKDLVVVE